MRNMDRAKVLVPPPGHNNPLWEGIESELEEKRREGSSLHQKMEILSPPLQTLPPFPLSRRPFKSLQICLGVRKEAGGFGPCPAWYCILAVDFWVLKSNCYGLNVSIFDSNVFIRLTECCHPCIGRTSSIPQMRKWLDVLSPSILPQLSPLRGGREVKED